MSLGITGGRSPLSALATLLVGGLLLVAMEVRGQEGTCATRPLEAPARLEIRCSRVTIEIEAGAEADLLDADGDGVPEGLRLDSGAALIHYGDGGKDGDFQILTPHAIASVRGTTWAVEVEARKTAVFVVEGTVIVVKRGYGSEVLLRGGEGVDADAGPAPLQVRQWGAKRIEDLLARFGR